MIRLSQTLLILLFITSCQTTVTSPSGTKVGTPQSAGEKPSAAPPKPALKLVEMPKIGLILGPGAFKTFSHLGVLREFEKSGFKVQAIVGMEWGSLVGAIYAMKGRANDLEWQLSKLKKSDLPQDGNFG